MKKLLEKIVAISLTVVGALLIALLLVLMFKAVSIDELDNQLVKILILSFSAIFAVLAVICIAAAFTDNDKLTAILLFKDKESATKATVSVVKKLTKKAAKPVTEAKVTKVALFVDENNNVKLRVAIKVKSDDTDRIIDRVRAAIVTTFDSVMDVQFASIDFKVTKLKTAFKPADAEIDAKVKAYQKEREEARAKAQKAQAETAVAEPIAETAVVENEVVETAPETAAAETVAAEEPAEEIDIAVAAPTTEVLTSSASGDQDAEEVSPQVQSLEEAIHSAEAEPLTEDQTGAETSEESEPEEKEKL